MPITIRAILSGDAEVVAQLSHQFGYTVTETEMLHRIEQVLNSQDHVGFVATANQQVVGWIHGFYTFRLESEPFVEIGGLVVDEHWRGQSIGRLLLEQVKAWATGFGVHKIRVRCNITRTTTHKFYLKAGFTESKEQKVFDLLF